MRPYSYSSLVLKTVRNSGLLLPLPFIFSCIWQIVFSLSCKKMNASLVFLQTYWVLLTLIVNCIIIFYEDTSRMSSIKFFAAAQFFVLLACACLKNYGKNVEKLPLFPKYVAKTMKYRGLKQNNWEVFIVKLIVDNMFIDKPGFNILKWKAEKTEKASIGFLLCFCW